MRRYATAADLERFYGERPIQTMRAVVVLLGDEPVIVMGLAYRPECALLFSDYKPQAWEHRKSMSVLRAIKQAMELVKTSRRPVYAVKDDGSDLLDSLGFECVREDLYQWHS